MLARRYRWYGLDVYALDFTGALAFEGVDFVQAGIDDFHMHSRFPMVGI